ncbi:MAG: ABC transporter permease subunit [Chloroflexia bacterium]|nr:ABC transporter permease subunit [Chloroflexia bacterium]
MPKQRISTGLVVLGLLVAVLGGWLWYFTRGWRYAPLMGLLLLLGLAVAISGVVGGKKARGAATQVLGQIACLLILVSVMFPVLWVVGMAMDPRDILRPLDLSPITNIPTNLLRVLPKRFPLPEQAAVLDLQRVPSTERAADTIDVMGSYYKLPEGWTKDDLRRDDVWLVGKQIIDWRPITPLAEDADSLAHPNQVTLLPPKVEIESLLPLDDAVRPAGSIVLNGEAYAVPKAWGIKKVDRPTFWLVGDQVVHWGILSELLDEEDMLQPLGDAESPTCWIELKKEEGRFHCPYGAQVEAVDEPSYWLSDDHMALCNGKKSSDISKGHLGDVSHFPAIWLQGRSVVDWRASSTRAFAAVIRQPTQNPVGFGRLLLNSSMLAVGVSLFCMLIGTTAAYAFSRFQFPGREVGMLGFVIVLMMPSVATLAPLYAILNAIQVKPSVFQWGLLILGVLAGLGGLLLILRGLLQRTAEGWRWMVLPVFLIVVGLVLNIATLRAISSAAGEAFVLRNSLWGVGIAMVAGSLPFSIWNMKGFIDTIPKELEEAAIIDGASPTQTFFQIMLPLALPGLAVTALFGFIAGWTEFVLSWQFLTEAQNFTLAMALYGMQGERNTPWSNFAAMSILVSIPVTAVFFALQKYIVGGLTLGAVKG